MWGWRGAIPLSVLHAVCERLAATLTPLALLSVGLQQRLELSRSRLPAVGYALVADQDALEPALARAVLGLAILLSLASVPGINTLL